MMNIDIFLIRPLYLTVDFMKFNNVFIISNYRSFFIILLMFYNKNMTNSLFLLDHSLKLKKIQTISQSKVIFSRKPKNALFSFLETIISTIYFLYLLRSSSKNDILVFGADHIMGSKFFLRRFSFFVVEDGSANYDLNSYKRSWKNKLFSIPTFGVYKNVKKIYLTQKENIPEIIKHKVEIINIQSIWKSKTQDEKECILSFFDIDSSKLSILKQKRIILFTQPLSEDGILTENEKIVLYKKILDKYDVNSLVIKPHPREITDYSKYFPSAYLFKDACPSELLELLEIDFDKVITLFSTAVLQYKEDKVDFYGTECHPKLHERFGILEFYKTNCSI